MGLFGSDNKNSYEKSKEKVNELCSRMRKESRLMDRQINAIQREEQKTIAMIKDAAKKNQMDVCKISAKSLVQSKKQKARIYASQAQINSIVMQMKNQLGQMRIAGAMKSSTQVMQSMSQLMKLPELQRTMQELSKEMMKTGIIDELITDSIDSVLDDGDADMDSVAEAEVDKIILEVTQGKLKELPDVIKGSVASGSRAGASALAADEDEDDEVEPEEEITKRLEALKS